MHIRIRGHGQRAAGGSAAFGDVHGCGGQHRRVIAAVDGHGQGTGGRAAVSVGRRERKGIGETFPHPQALHRGQRIIQAICIVARGIQCERAIEPGRTCLRHKTHCIVQIRVRRRGQRAVDVGRILNNGSRGCGDDRRVVAAVDGHGQGIGASAPAPVGYREGKGISEAFPRTQALHRGQRIVQRIGIVAVGIHGKCAVQTGRAGLRNESHNIMHVRVHGRGQRAADAGRIFTNGSRGSGHGGRVIAAAVDAHGHDRGRRAAVIVGHRDRERVAQAVRGAQSPHCGQGGVQHIGIVAVGIHAERAVTARRIGQWREADRIMHIHVRGHGQGAAGDGSVFVNAHYRGGQHRRVIAAVDGHGQGAGGRAAVAVGRREGKCIGEAFSHTQALHRGQRIVQGIGIIARGIQRERAVAARRIGLRREADQIMNIRIHRRGQRAADVNRIFGNGSRGSGHGGRVVCPVDDHSQGIGGRAAMVIGHRERKGVGEAFPHAQALHRGRGIIQDIGVIARSIQRERAVTARCIGLRREADRIMNIHIRGHGQDAADAGRILGNGGCGSGHDGRVVCPVDGHGQGICGRAAVSVGHCKGESVGEAFAHAQALHRGRGIVQGIGIVAVGVHVERAVLTGGIGLGEECHCIMGIRIHGRGQRAADVNRILGDVVRCRRHGGRVVCPVDGHGQGTGGRAAVAVGCRERKGISEAFPHAQALHRGQRIIQDIGVIA